MHTLINVTCLEDTANTHHAPGLESELNSQPGLHSASYIL